METALNNYLEKIEKYLKPMDASERIDIVKEIKSEILELQNEGKTSDEIIERLGNPKELAKAYLGEAISKNTSFSLKKAGSVIAFYSLAGTIWMFILPVTSIVGISFMFSGIIVPIGGIIKFAGYLLGYEIPVIILAFGSYSVEGFALVPVSIITGLLLFIVGRLFWILTIRLIKGISISKRKLVC